VEEKDQKTGTLKVVLLSVKNPTTQFVDSSDLVQEVCSAEALQHLHSYNYDTTAALKSFVSKAPKLDFDTCTLVDDHVAKRKHPDKNGWNAPFTRRPDVKKMQGRIQQTFKKIDVGTLVYPSLFSNLSRLLYTTLAACSTCLCTVFKLEPTSHLASFFRT
jgi:hypothetical protein